MELKRESQGAGVMSGEMQPALCSQPPSLIPSSTLSSQKVHQLAQISSTEPIRSASPNSSSKHVCRRFAGQELIHSFRTRQSNNSLNQLSALSVEVTAFVTANSEAFCHHKAYYETPRLIPATLRLQYLPQRFHERPYSAVGPTLAP